MKKKPLLFVVLAAVILLMTISTTAAFAGEPDANAQAPVPDREQLAESCNTDYGLNDIKDNIRDDAMLEFYGVIDDIERAFFLGDQDAAYSNEAGEYAAGTAVIDPQKLSSDKILQTYALYRMDHPLYFWMKESPAVVSVDDTASTVYLTAAAEYASAGTRAEMYSSLAVILDDFTGYMEGSTSPYTIATASLYKLAQMVDYAYAEGKEPSAEIWAHSIAGVIDGVHKEVVCEGYAKFYQLLMNYFGIPIIAMTANAFKEDVEAAKEAGMQGHVAKPIDIDKLKHTLKEVLGIGAE